MRDKYPILEFHPTPRAVIEPSDVIERQEVPEHCVLCLTAGHAPSGGG